MNNATLSPINDLSSYAFDELFARFQELDTERLLIYLFDKVEESALVHLAEQFHITGNEGWANCSNVSEKRDLIKNSLNLHRFRGTRFSLVRVLDILGLNGQLEEWFQYGGKPYHFKITVDMNNNILCSLEDIKHDFYVGVDVGRRKDLTVIWVLEKLEHICYTRMVIELSKMPFYQQEEILSEILSHKLFRRDCQDDTGIGMQMAENAQRKFGKYRVEGVTFTNRVKEELAYNLRTHFENKTVFIPKQHEIREDLHSIRRITTTANNIRFDADHSENGHADRFWALALALHAADNGAGKINICLNYLHRLQLNILRIKAINILGIGMNFGKMHIKKHLQLQK